MSSDAIVLKIVEVERIVIRDVPPPGVQGPVGPQGPPGVPVQNIDGGHADTQYGATTPIDGGTP